MLKDSGCVNKRLHARAIVWIMWNIAIIHVYPVPFWYTCLHIHPPSNEICVGMNNCVARAVRLEFKYSLDTWMQVNCKICYISTLYAIPHVLALNWPLAPAGNVCFFVGSMVHIGLVSVKSVLLVHWNQVNLSVAFSSIWMQNVNIGNHGKLRQRRLLPSFPP